MALKLNSGFVITFVPLPPKENRNQYWLMQWLYFCHPVLNLK